MRHEAVVCKRILVVLDMPRETHDVRDLADEADDALGHRLLRPRLRIDEVHGDEARLVFRQLDAEPLAEVGDGTQCTLIFFRIEALRLPEHHVVNRDALAHAVDGHVDVVGQGDVDAVVELHAELFFRLLDDGVRCVHVVGRNACEQFLEMLEHLGVAEAVDFVDARIVDRIAAMAAERKPAPHRDDFPLVAVVRDDDIVIQDFFDDHRSGSPYK